MPASDALELIQRAYHLRESKQFAEALALAKECLKQFPDNPESHCLFAILYLDQKKYLEAEKAFNIAISLYPKKADYYFLLGETLKAQRRFQEAQNAYEQCLKINQNHEHALLHLGGLFASMGNTNEAIQAFNRILLFKPHFAQAHYRLGLIYHKQDNLKCAIDHYEKALQTNPNDLNILSNLGAAFTKDRQYQKGIEILTNALNLHKDFLPAITNLGGIYVEINQFAKAEKYLRRSVFMDPSLAENWRNLTLCVTYKRIGIDAKAIKKILVDPRTSENDKIHAYFALGKIYHDCHKYEEAFAYFSEGNNLRSKKIIFKPEFFKNHISWIIKTFDKSSVFHFDFQENSKPVPLIIVGTSRSGKSILEGLLKQISGIAAAGEVGIAEFGSRIPQGLLPKGNYPFWIKDLTFDQTQVIRNTYYERLKRDNKEDNEYIMDTIPGNFIYLGLIAMLFPEAKFIYCQREPLDACLLMYFKYFVHGHGYTCRLDTLAAFYQQFERMMHHWKNLFNDKILDVHYEDVVQAPNLVLKKITEYLKVKTPAKLNFRRLTTKEINCWKNYKDHLSVLIEAFQHPPTEEMPEKTTNENNNSINKLKDLMGCAYQHYLLNQFIQAKAECEAIIEEQADYYPALHLLGNIYQSENNGLKAIAFFEKALQISISNSQLHLDLANALKMLGRQMEAENHIQQAEKIQQEKGSVFRFASSQRSELLNAFSVNIDILDEYESRLLLQGKVSGDHTTGSYLTRSWDRYFHDLSFGSYRLADDTQKHAWRMRAWHFLYKNIAIIDYILNQSKDIIRILDVGCSTGYFRRFLEGNINNRDNKKIFYWGLDIREEVLALAVKGVDDLESGAKGNRVPSAFIIHDISYGLPYKDNHFDYIINFEMIKYLPVELGNRLVPELYRVLAPGGNLYLSTTYTSFRPGFMENVPFERIERILTQAGFTINQRRGSQTRLEKIVPHLQEDHIPLVKSLLSVHPAEMVAAMITPLYPQCAEQVTFYCKKN